MIQAIARDVGDVMSSRKCRVRVLGRDKRTPAGWLPERVVIEHDLQASDAFSGARSQRENPKHSFTRGVAAKATIYAKSPRDGATEFEHRERAEAILDQLLFALRYVAAGRKNTFAPKSGRFVVPADVAASDVHGGAAYELKFSIDRAVQNRTFDGAAKPSATLVRAAMTGDPLLTFAADETITRSAGSWVADGFAAGMLASVRGSTSNDVTGAQVVSVSPLVLTLGSTSLSAEGPVAGCKVIAGGVRSAAYVSLRGGPDDDDNYVTVPADAELVWEQD